MKKLPFYKIQSTIHPNDMRHVSDWILTSRLNSLNPTPEEKEAAAFAEKIYSAVKNGSHKKLKAAFDSFELQKNISHLPKTLPLLAVHKNGSEVLRILHHAGFEIGATNHYSENVWQLAADRELNNIIETLLDLKISPNTRKKIGEDVFTPQEPIYSPLTICMEKRNTDLFLKLLPLGLPQEKKDSFDKKQKAKDIFSWILKNARSRNQIKFIKTIIPVLFQQNYSPINDGSVYQCIFENPKLEEKGGTFNILQSLSEQGLVWTPKNWKTISEHWVWKHEIQKFQSMADLAESIHLKEKLLKELPGSPKPDKKMRL